MLPYNHVIIYLTSKQVIYYKMINRIVDFDNSVEIWQLDKIIDRSRLYLEILNSQIIT